MRVHRTVLIIGQNGYVGAAALRGVPRTVPSLKHVFRSPTYYVGLGIYMAYLDKSGARVVALSSTGY